jgi:hypothetical protein
MGAKIPTFDGEALNFPSWWKQFLAHATMSNFKEVLNAERDKDLPREEVSEEDDDLTKQQKTVIRKNN